jgi:hypothetical protein
LSSHQSDFHSSWTGTKFSSPYTDVCKRFRKRKDVTLFQVNVEELGSKPELDQACQGPAAIVLFDMDLYGPTRKALSWIRPLLQQGTLIIFDELYHFRGDPSKGEFLALNEF